MIRVIPLNHSECCFLSVDVGLGDVVGPGLDRGASQEDPTRISPVNRYCSLGGFTGRVEQ